MAFIEPFPYYPATVAGIHSENERVKTLVLKAHVPWEFQAGQHVVLRLTDESGYIAARDYSLTSAPSSGILEISVRREKGGEVSNWVHDRLAVGAEVQISQPLGKNFSWTPDESSPLLLIAGGIGLAPLISIWREHRLTSAASTIHLAYSVSTAEDICFQDELRPIRDNERSSIWLTRESTASDSAHTGRITAETLQSLLLPDQRIFICGPTSFVDAMEKLVHAELHVPASNILTERFG